MFRATSQPFSNMETTPSASRAVCSDLWKWPALYQASLSPGSSSLPSSWRILRLWEARRLRGALVRSSNRTQSLKPPDGKILWQRPGETDTLSNVTAHIICENQESLGLADRDMDGENHRGIYTTCPCGVSRCSQQEAPWL